MRSFVHVALFLLVVLEMAAGLLAGSVALASLITEAAARTASMRRPGPRPPGRCRPDLAAAARGARRRTRHQRHDVRGTR